MKTNKGIGRSVMSDALVKVLRSFEAWLGGLESEFLIPGRLDIDTRPMPGSD